MRKSNVVLAVSKSYAEEKVYELLRDAVAALGGIEHFAGPEENILVKPNLLYPSKKEKCITTNPSVIKAVRAVKSRIFPGCNKILRCGF